MKKPLAALALLALILAAGCARAPKSIVDKQSGTTLSLISTSSRHTVYRMPVEGGWLYLAQLGSSGTGAAFVPDPSAK